MIHTAAQIALGVYTLLLAVGGVMGFVKAQSRPSLIAGVGSAIVAAGLLVWSFWQSFLGIAIAGILALALASLFARRFAKTRKAMPSGMLLLVSLVMALFLGAVAALNRP
jgi:uncharacterized membrane protein (UPF0136 family)